MFFRILDDRPLPRLQAPAHAAGPCAIVLLDAPPWREAPTDNHGFAALCDAGEIRVGRCVATAAAVEAGGVDVALMAVPSVIPAVQTGAPAGSSPHFAGARQAVARHASHLFVGASCGSGFHDQRRAALAVSTVAGAFGGLGVLWPAAGVIAAPERLSRIAEDARAARWPVDVWIGARLFGEPRGGEAVGAVSCGAERFFGYEIAIAPRAAVDPPVQVRLLYAVASWLMTAGPVLADGDGLGPAGPETAHTLVARLRSGADGGADVMEFHRAPLQ